MLLLGHTAAPDAILVLAAELEASKFRAGHMRKFQFVCFMPAFVTGADQVLSLANVYANVMALQSKYWAQKKKTTIDCILIFSIVLIEVLFTPSTPIRPIR